VTSRPRPLRPPLALVARAVVPLVAVLVGLGLLGSCAGERPSLGEARIGGTTTTAAAAETVASTPGSTTTTTTLAVAQELGPENLLGYIATPTGEPVVRTLAEIDAMPLDIPSTTPAGAPTTFAVIGDPTATTGEWLEVLLPTRPNGARAWVPRSSVTITKTPMRIFVDLTGRRLRVEDGGREVFSTTTAIGTSENPTPVGASYVTELIDNVEPGGAYGPYAFGLALHSDTLSEFGGGNGQVGIHGTNQPQLIGQAVSHGCVRLTNDDIEALVDLQLPLGVPVFIT
jgi:lipoprotein-anchoring transpeptidase ErfK/SrfK